MGHRVWSQCCATGKPYDYHNEPGEYMIASHWTPIICRFRDCLNPDHLYWEAASDGCRRREAEERARNAASTLSSLLSIPMLYPSAGSAFAT
jgi:hypothetical protein